MRQKEKSAAGKRKRGGEREKEKEDGEIQKERKTGQRWSGAIQRTIKAELQCVPPSLALAGDWGHSSMNWGKSK